MFTDHAYSKDQLLDMERYILKELEYQICVPTGYHFLERYLNFINAPDGLRYLSFYYAERNLQEYDMLNVRPDQFVAAAVYAALRKWMPHCEDSNIWPIELCELTGFTEADLIIYASNILKHVQEETVTASRRHLVATKKKYAREKYNFVSTLTVPVLGPVRYGR